MKVRVYVAGPMTGLPELNFPAFHRAAASLRASGYEVVNPAEINSDPAAGWNACMRQDIAQLVTCDQIALLPGWERSRGATIEARLAADLGMQRIYFTQDGDVQQPPPVMFHGKHRNNEGAARG